MPTYRDPSMVVRALARHKDLMLANDLRVGQFIVNAQERASASALFYIEDNKLVEALDAYAAFLQGK